MLDARAVVIITGPPGAGKTTVADGLARDAVRSAHVEGDWFFRFLRSGFIPPWMPEAEHQNQAVLDITCDVVAGYSSAGYTVFWDGIVGPWHLDRIVARLAEHDLTPSYVVLRPSAEKALARVELRDGSGDRSGADVMYSKFQSLGPLERHVLSSDGPVDDVLSAVRAALEAGALRLHAR